MTKEVIWTCLNLGIKQGNVVWAQNKSGSQNVNEHYETLP